MSPCVPLPRPHLRHSGVDEVDAKSHVTDRNLNVDYRAVGALMARVGVPCYVTTFSHPETRALFETHETRERQSCKYPWRKRVTSVSDELSRI